MTHPYTEFRDLGTGQDALEGDPSFIEETVVDAFGHDAFQNMLELRYLRKCAENIVDAHYGDAGLAGKR